MTPFSAHRRLSRLLGAVALVLYLLSLSAEVLHAPGHHHEDEEHFGFGLCDSDCAEHRNCAEDCGICLATSTKSVAAIRESAASHHRFVQVVACGPARHAGSVDTQLPGLRAPPLSA